MCLVCGYNPDNFNPDDLLPEFQRKMDLVRGEVKRIESFFTSMKLEGERFEDLYFENKRIRTTLNCRPIAEQKILVQIQFATKARLWAQSFIDSIPDFSLTTPTPTNPKPTFELEENWGNR